MKKKISCAFNELILNTNWWAKFHYFNEEKDFEEIIEKHLDQQKIFFDEKVTQIDEVAQNFIRVEETSAQMQRVLRVEGTATQDIEDRIYYDVALLKIKNKSGFFLFESWSSVLNGAIEGPYFEEVLNRLKIIK